MEFKTTFWSDFSIADHFGPGAVQDTYNRAFKEWHSDCEYLTELVIVLNHKIWQHYEKDNSILSHLYDKLWRDTADYAVTHLKGEDLEYYLEVTD